MLNTGPAAVCTIRMCITYFKNMYQFKYPSLHDIFIDVDVWVAIKQHEIILLHEEALS